MIRLAYLIDTISCATSGTEKQLLEIIRRLDKHKFQPYLICLYESSWMRDNPLPCPCFVLGYQGLLKRNIFQIICELRNVVQDLGIQILQTFFEDSIFVAWLATRSLVKDIVLLSSRRDMGLDRVNMLWYHKLFNMIRPFVNQSYDGILANSLQVKEYVVRRERVPVKKIEVVFNGVDFYEKNEKCPAVFRDNPADVWGVIVASLVPVKRHDLLIKAVSLLNGKIGGIKFRVLVLGTGFQKEKLVTLARQENVRELFHFEGTVQNVTDYLQHADIGILCSDREGLSNAILEYMATGLPVIATAVGGNIELVDETNGSCVPPNDPRALADALLKLITNEREREEKGRFSRERVTAEFSWKKSMRQLEEYYQALMVKKGGACE